MIIYRSNRLQISPQIGVDNLEFLEEVECVDSTDSLDRYDVAVSAENFELSWLDCGLRLVDFLFFILRYTALSVSAN